MSISKACRFGAPTSLGRLMPGSCWIPGSWRSYGQKIGTSLFIGGYKSHSPLDVHIKESSIKICMGSKGSMLKTLIGLRKIAESRCSGIIEDPFGQKTHAASHV